MAYAKNMAPSKWYLVVKDKSGNDSWTPYNTESDAQRAAQKAQKIPGVKRIKVEPAYGM